MHDGICNGQIATLAFHSRRDSIVCGISWLVNDLNEIIYAGCLINYICDPIALDCICFPIIERGLLILRWRCAIGAKGNLIRPDPQPVVA
jgi:hypothetical protein